MDIAKFMVSDTLEDFKMIVDEEEFVLKVKPLTWSMRNKALSEAIKIDKDGGLKIDVDSYSKYILCARIAQAPWGATSFTILNGLSPEVGIKLEQLVPSIWGASTKDDELKNVSKE